MLESPLARAVAIALCLCALIGLFVWFGALEPAPDHHRYAGGDEVVADADRYVGQPVELSGHVVATDPVRIEVDSDYESTELVVRDAPAVEDGQYLSVYGTLTDAETVEAEGTVARESWEFTYMYAVSAIAALWVLARAVRQWRFDPTRGIVPRDEPLTLDGASSGGETDG